ncbi:hypothetical protein M407DRAFT_10843 [Tulasnella calospora MUT 4182]|uniref:F-box domain-containing protein n=1 Tax=Tulasnella calospora MUT 4182 TaxID=1051891 RepID=A0A0C3LGE7_9AGAM|nr:hypothetical protein M407DRAFT_10843 [Tulasnella calospora MUT 4182]
MTFASPPSFTNFYIARLLNIDNYDPTVFHGETASTLAARCPSRRLVKLLSNSADPKIRNADQRTTEDYILEDERFRYSPHMRGQALALPGPSGVPGAYGPRPHNSTAAQHTVGKSSSTISRHRSIKNLPTKIAIWAKRELFSPTFKQRLPRRKRPPDMLNQQGAELDGQEARLRALEGELKAKMSKRFRLGWRKRKMRAAVGGEANITLKKLPTSPSAPSTCPVTKEYVIQLSCGALGGTYVTLGNLASAARVSKLWFDLAVPTLWAALPSVTPLFRILSPLTGEGPAGLVFAQPFPPEKLERLLLYGKHVRHLQYSDHDRDPVTASGYSHLSSDTIIWFIWSIASSPGPILPNLQEIHWSAIEEIYTLHLILPLLHASVKILKIRIRECDDPDCNSVGRFFDAILGVRGLALNEFEFDFVDAPVEIISGFAQFLQQTQLRALDFPMQAPSLESATAQNLIHAALPTSLQVLRTRVTFEDRGDYISRAETITSRVPFLHTLRLHLDGDSWSPSGYGDIRPFSTLQHLEELELVSDRAFHLAPDEIPLLGQSLPRLRKLSLRGIPEQRPHLGIKVLDLIACASAFPQLQALAISIQPMTASIGLPWWSDEQAPTPFNTASFVELDVGSSFIQDNHISIIAELISRLCLNSEFKIRCASVAAGARVGVRNWSRVENGVRRIQGAQRDFTVPYHVWCGILLANM